MKPDWLTLAESKIGQHEICGVDDNPFIVECHATTTLKAKDDETAWCASFINWCITKVGLKGTNSAAAKSWLSWGQALTEPREGCVTVIRQKQTGADKSTGSTSGYHVALFNKIEDGRIFLLGGNQSDSVKVSSFGLKSYEVAGYRWPEGIKEMAQKRCIHDKSQSCTDCQRCEK